MKSYILRTISVLIAAACLWARPCRALTSVTGSAAANGSQETLSGQVTTGTASAAAFFAYWAVGSSVTNETPAISVSPSTGAVSISANISLVGLANQTIRYQLIASNSMGTAQGSVLSFAAPAQAPVLTCLNSANCPPAAASITATSAGLIADVNPNDAATVVTFVYGLSGSSNGYGFATTPANINGGLQAVEVTANGLQPNTVYYYGVIASNKAGVVSNNNLTFTTPASTPTLGSLQAIVSGPQSATLSGTVNPLGSQTLWHFEYWMVGSDVTNDTATNTLGNAQSGVAVSAFAGPLVANACYNWRLVAVNQSGTTAVDSVAPFCAESSPPTVTTGSATGLTPHSALLEGHIIPNGESTVYYFLWGTGALTNSTATVEAGNGSTSVAMNSGLAGLSPNTQYDYQAVGSNAEGQQLGNIQSFTTPIAVSPLASPPNVYTVTNAVTQVATAIAFTFTNRMSLQYVFLTGGGAGYTSVPNVVVNPNGPGCCAHVTATVQNGEVVALTLDAAGSGYPTNEELSVVIDPPSTEIQDAANNSAYDTIFLPKGNIAANVIFKRNVTVIGEGAGFTTVNGSGRGSVFQVDAGADVEFENMTITGGSSTNGGGILNNGGTVDIEGCDIVGNTAVNFGGGVMNFGNAVMTINDSEIAQNTASLAGAGLCGDGLGTTFNLNGTNIVASVKTGLNYFFGGMADFVRFGINIGIDVDTGITDFSAPDFFDAIERQVNPGTLEAEGSSLMSALDNYETTYDDALTNVLGDLKSLDFVSKVRAGLGDPLGVGNSGSGSGWFKLGASVCTVSNCIIADNLVNAYASGYDAGVHNELGLMKIINSQITGNQVTSHIASYGGGVGNMLGALNLENCIISEDNVTSDTVLSGGGAIFNLAGLLQVTDGQLNDNSADAILFAQGGAIYNTLYGQVNISQSQLNYNTSTGGGAIDNEENGEVNITNSIIASNAVEGFITSYGGALMNRTQGNAILSGCAVFGNSASGYARGGAIYTQVTGTGTNVSFQFTTTGEVRLVNCTIASNLCQGGYLLIADPAEVAACILYHEGCNFADLPTIKIPLDSHGGAIYNGTSSDAYTNDYTADSTLDISFCTIVGNSVTGPSPLGAGIYLTCSSSYNPLLVGNTILNIDDSIVARNINTNLAVTLSRFQRNYFEDITGDGGAGTQTNSFGYNLVSDYSISKAVVQTNWEYGPIANNGGPTATMALLPGSLALGGGCPAPNNGVTFPFYQPTDQRGVTRPQPGGPDIGAYENSMPQAGNQSFWVYENHTLQVPALTLFSNSIGAGLQITANNQPTHGQLTFLADGGFTYTPSSNYYGSDAFQFDVTDLYTNTSSIATVTITVLPVVQFVSDSIGLTDGDATAGAFSVDFSSPVDAANNQGSVIVTGSESVTLPATVTGTGTNLVVTPEANFHPGELVTVEFLKSLVATNGGLLLQSKTFQYITAARGGSGIFPTSNYLGDNFGVAIALADLNGDGAVDAFVADTSADKVYLNDGHGNFTLAQTLPGNSTGVALGDLNGDGFPDAIVTKAGGILGASTNFFHPGFISEYNRVYFNDGTGHFVQSSQGLVPATFISYDTAQNPATLTPLLRQQLAVALNECSSAVAIGDLNGDGYPDVVLANNTTLGIQGQPYATPGNSVWWNDGEGGFTRGPTFGTAAAYAVALADVNGDGLLDILVGDDKGIEIWLNNGEGGFAAGPVLSKFNNGYYSVHSFSVGDVNGDGLPDILASLSGNANGPKPWWGNQVWLNDGQGGFTNGEFFVGNVQARSLALGDLNGDGKLDMFATGFFGSEVWTNRGNGTFSPKAQPFGILAAGQGVALADLDGDGDLDAFTVNAIPGAVGSTPSDFVYFNDSPPIVPNLQYEVPEGGSLTISAPGLFGGVTDPDGPDLALKLTEPYVYIATTLGILFQETIGVAHWSSANLGYLPNGDSTYTNIVPLYAEHGALDVNAEGSFTYTPNPYFYGTDTFPLIVSDGYLTGSNLVTITVNEVVTPPLVQNDYYPYSGGVLTVNAAQGVLANDQDQNSVALSASLLQPASHGVVVLNADGSFTYTPNSGYNGPDVFTYLASDSQASNSARVKIGDTAPVAVFDYYSMPGNGVIAVPALNGVLANDSDADGDTLTAVEVSAPAHGQVTLNSDGSFNYTRFTNYASDDSFTYQASDGIELSTAVKVRLGDSVPVAHNDAYGVLTNTTLGVGPALGVLKNDIDADGYPLTPTLLTSTLDGSLTFNPDGSFSYTPQSGFAGVDSFTYSVSDGVQTSAPATVSITVGASTISVLSVAPVSIAPTNATIVLRFSSPVSETLQGANLVLNGSMSGVHVWSGYGASNAMIVTTPTAFRPGERVTATLDPGLESFNGAVLARSYVWNFYIAAPRGSGNFAQQTSYLLTNDYEGGYASQPIVGDFDGDGLLDAFVVEEYGPVGMHFFHNNGDRSFSNWLVNTPSIYDYPICGVAGDFRGDGKLEMYMLISSAVGGGNYTGLWTFDGNSTLTSSSVTSAAASLNDETHFIGIGDFNGDGFLDVIGFNDNGLNNGAGGTIWVMTNDGAGNLTLGPTTPVNDGLVFVPSEVVGFDLRHSCGIGDANGDGKLDIWLTSGTASDLWTNDGTGHFAQQPQLAQVSQLSNSGFGAAFADFNGDGTLDGLVINDVSLSAATDEYPLNLSTNLGGGLFATNTTVVTIGPLVEDDQNYIDSDIGDMTGQGRLDAIYQSKIALNNGLGQFSLASLPDVATNYGVAVADFDGDGALDIFDAGDRKNIQQVMIAWNTLSPVAVNDYYPAGTLSVAAGGVLTNDLSGSGGAMRAVLVSQPVNATVALSSNGGFVITPGTGFVGVTSFTYKDVDSNNVASYPGLVKIGDTAPVATNAGPITLFNTGPQTIGAPPGLLSQAFDADGDPLYAYLASEPGHGVVVVQTNGSFTYTAAPGYAGPDSFTYYVFDGISNSPLATVSLNIIPRLDVVAETPAINALGIGVNPNISVTFDHALDPNTLVGQVSVSDSRAGAHVLTATVSSNVLNMHLTSGFSAGAVASVSLGAGIRGLDGATPRGPFVWQFTMDAPVGRGSLVDSGQRFDLPPLTNCAAAALMDVNNDGYLDAIVASQQYYSGGSWQGGYTTIWTNNGHGKLSDSGERLTAPGVLVSSVALGDINNQGYQDLAVSGLGCTGQLWTNDHAGHFYLAAKQLPAGGFLDMAFADVNGDGNQDLIGDATVSVDVMTNDGHGNFSITQTITPAYDFAVGDVNNDGSVDLVIGVNPPGNPVIVYVYTNNGSGVFAQFGLGITAPSLGEVTGMALADMNHDGYLDLVMEGATTLEVWLNNQHGSFTDSGQRISAASTFGNTKLHVGDLNGDGAPDVVLAGGGTPVVFYNNGAGILGASVSLGSTAWDVAIGDLNGDGSPDIFVPGFQTSGEEWTNKTAIGNIEGAQAIQTTDHTNTIPFPTISFPGVSSSSITCTVTQSSTGNGSFTTASLSAGGFTGPVGSTYMLSGTTLSAAQSAVDQLVFTPKINQSRVGQSVTTTFTITVSDGTITRTNNQSTVAALAIDDPPVAAAQSGGGFQVRSTATLTTSSLVSHCTDPNPGDQGELALYNLITTGTFGAVSNAGSNRVLYNPNGKFNYLKNGQTSNDVFKYVITDPWGELATNTVTIQVQGVTINPTVPTVTLSVPLHSGAVDVTAQLLLNAYSAVASNTPELSITAVNTTGTIGQATLASGHVMYNPNNAFGAIGQGSTAADSFKFTVTDVLGGHTIGTAEVTIVGQNDPPTAVNDFITLDANAAPTNLTQFVLTNDVDADAHTNSDLTIIGLDLSSTKGNVTLTNGLITYQPGPVFSPLPLGSNAVDTFKYTVVNTNGLTAQAIVTVTNEGVNYAPLAPNLAFSVVEGQLVGLGSSILAATSDPNTGETATLQLTGVVTSNTLGTAVFSAGDITYQPNPILNLTIDETSTDVFGYVVTDIHGASSTGQVTMTITGKSVPPVAQPASIVLSSASAPTNLTELLLSGATDPNPLDTLRLYISGFYTNGSAGAVALTADNQIYYTAVGHFAALTPGESANDSFAYILSDPFGATATAEVTVTVIGPPVVTLPVQTAGTFQFQIAGFSNTVCTVEISSNLVDWIIVGAATETSPGVFSFSQSVPAGIPALYYQVVQSITNLPGH